MIFLCNPSHLRFYFSRSMLLVLLTLITATPFSPAFQVPFSIPFSLYKIRLFVLYIVGLKLFIQLPYYVTFISFLWTLFSFQNRCNVNVKNLFSLFCLVLVANGIDLYKNHTHTSFAHFLLADTYFSKSLKRITLKQHLPVFLLKKKKKHF